MALFRILSLLLALGSISAFLDEKLEMTKIIYKGGDGDCRDEKDWDSILGRSLDVDPWEDCGNFQELSDPFILTTLELEFGQAMNCCQSKDFRLLGIDHLSSANNVLTKDHLEVGIWFRKSNAEYPCGVLNTNGTTNPGKCLGKHFTVCERPSPSVMPESGKRIEY